MNDNILNILNEFRPVTLDEMDKIRLMNRTDDKFLTSRQKLIELLALAKNRYRVQEVDDERNISYRTLYLDTQNCDMYLAHHNGRCVREKIRIRTYMSSGLTFLEVKNKNNHGRTDKKRIRIENDDSVMKDGGGAFLHKFSWFELPILKRQLVNHFHRITLVNNQFTERLTIDSDLSFINLTTGHESNLDNLIVIELKRNNRAFSPIGEILQKMHIMPSRFSKYCIGSALTNENLKQNRFKQQIRNINKITNEMTWKN